MAVASGKRDASGRDLVFEQWYADNIAAVAGGRVEQRAILKEYRKGVAPGIALGEQGVERMLNRLGVKFAVRAGKRYRLGVGFKLQAANVPIGAGHLPEAVKLPPVRVELRDAQEADETPPPAAPVEGGADIFFSRAAFISDEILLERRRQIEVEGYDAAHDDASDPGAHERAAACYAYAAGQDDRVAAFVETNAKSPREGRFGWFVRDTLVMMWPWPHHFWKPKTDQPDWKRRCMVIAGALILAAIERYDRDKARQALADSQASQMTGV